ncbi:MAG TPA: Rid family detoxifying hydrolase [Candidatus Poseidoniia archaeon]|jgi:2-aminomuconate deaminase|nr:Rid family detoxifying hydrolase [Candidatus Poseidoniia archaeon]HJM81214.1 Rid family detoxifying hydrolase [Candidatus Poseidoniia archaeon]|tara:strand:- start:17 stop:388 length:372 start_codon:yes stop_codon:yes gene_type:complete
MAIRTDKAAKPVGAYVHAKEAGNLVFLSGVGPRHPETDEIPDGIEAQTHATFSNVTAILEAAGLNMSNVIDIMVFLTNMERDFKKFNSIYAQYLEGYETTRTTVEVGALPTPIAVEFKVVAKK